MGHRPRRVGDQIQRELADLLMNQIKDPRLGFATVTEVRMSRDLSHAKVWISVLGDRDEEEESLRSLKRAGGFLRREIAHRVRLRVAPELHFIADRTLDASARLEDLLRGTEPETPEEQGDEGES